MDESGAARFEHASTEAICYRLSRSWWCRSCVLNMLLPKQSAIIVDAMRAGFTLFWTCFYRSNLLSNLQAYSLGMFRFEHASTEAICYPATIENDTRKEVLNMLLPKQSAIRNGRSGYQGDTFWTCFYRSNLLSLTSVTRAVPAVLNMLLPKQSAIKFMEKLG